MTIRQSQWQQTVEVLKSSHELWSAGLSKNRYIDFLSQQMTHPHGKRNLRFMVYEKTGLVLSSCKLYRLEMKCGKATLPILGIGAVFTPPLLRGLGYAGQMLELVCDLAEDEGYAAAVLYSEIGSDFYQQYGFVDLGETNFVIDLSAPSQQVQNYLDMAKKRQGMKLDIEPLITDDADTLDFLDRHYRRWLSHHPFRFQRSDDFWSFKIMKERYLKAHSRLPWPQINLLKSKDDSGKTAYAIVEWVSGKLRVLEAIGSESTMNRLWLDIVSLAVSQDCNFIHGWEGTAPEVFGQLNTFERGWGRAMILPLNDTMDELLDQGNFYPCPLLELDHI